MKSDKRDLFPFSQFRTNAPAVWLIDEYVLNDYELLYLTVLSLSLSAKPLGKQEKQNQSARQMNRFLFFRVDINYALDWCTIVLTRSSYLALLIIVLLYVDRNHKFWRLQRPYNVIRVLRQCSNKLFPRISGSSIFHLMQFVSWYLKLDQPMKLTGNQKSKWNNGNFKRSARRKSCIKGKKWLWSSLPTEICVSSKGQFLESYFISSHLIP